MTEYVIGVDIGATKSHLALFDKDGNFTDLGHWGPLNYEVLPGLYAQLEDELGQFVENIMSKNGVKMNQVLYSVLGVGGVDTKRQHENISEILRRLKFEKFTLVNDAFLGIPAGNGGGTCQGPIGSRLPSGTGICAINGSGCTLAGINKEGKMLQIGGVDGITADKGGGYYIGSRLVSAVYSELFRKGEATIMTGLLFEKLGITSKYDYIERIHEKTLDGSFSIKACNQLMFEAVGQNDAVAAGILLEIAGSYADGLSCMIEELSFPLEDELNIIFAGSVFTKGEHPFLIDSIKAKISKDNPDRFITYKKLDIPNVAGAVVWALQSLGGKDNYHNKVSVQFRGVLDF